MSPPRTRLRTTRHHEPHEGLSAPARCPITRLKLWRIRRHISLQTLAYAASIPIHSLEKYEEGWVRIPDPHRGRLAHALNVGIEDIPAREDLYPVPMTPEAVEGWAWLRAFESGTKMEVALISGGTLVGTVKHLGDAGVLIALDSAKSRFIYYHAVAFFGPAEPDTDDDWYES